MDGQTAEYRYELGQVYPVEGYARKAIEAFKEAKMLTPTRPEILLALGNAYLLDEHYPEAVRELQELLESAPDYEIAWAQPEKALRAEGPVAQASQISTNR
jgi:tetratricopeptide (TPR) repeat protein